MKTFDLTATPRSEFGKKAAKAIRNSGVVPCVMYGGESTHHFQLDNESVKAILYTPNVYLMNITLEGKTYKAILKEAQFHPTKDNALHLDFMEVSENKPVVVELPVRLNGLAAGVKAGGKLSLDMRKLRVKGLYTNIPEILNLDVTELELGKTIQVADVKFDNLEVLNAKNAVVCGVKMTRGAAAAAASAE